MAEGALLAVSPGIAYALAFAYEAGTAAHFGYPRWLVDVNVASVLIAWGAIAFFGGLFIVVLYLAGTAFPLRPGLSLLRSRTTHHVAAGLFIGGYGAHLMWVKERDLLGFMFLGFGAIVLANTLVQYVTHPNAQPTSSLRERLLGAHSAFASAGYDFIPDSASRHIIRHTVYGRYLRIALTAVGIMWFTFYVVQLAGEYNARRQSTWLVSAGRPEVVVVHKYEDMLVTMPLDRRDRVLLRRYSLRPLSDTTAQWIGRNLGRLRVQAPAAR